MPTILRSYGRAAETFAPSDKGWHGFFASSPRGPRFLHPRELAVAQGFPWGFALPDNCTEAWQLIGNSIPPPMAYLGLLGPAAALGGLGPTHRKGTWAADGFLRCCRASNGAWGTPPPLRPATDEQRDDRRSRSPPRLRVEAGNRGQVLCARPPSWPTPQVAMTQGRRATEDEAPTTIWIDPPDGEEVRDLLVVLQAMRSGAFTAQHLPGAASRNLLRVRGVDAPPRQGCVTPVPSSPESVEEPSPRELTRSRSPRAAGDWRPTRAFAALTLATLTAGAQGSWSAPMRWEGALCPPCAGRGGAPPRPRHGHRRPRGLPVPPVVP